MRDWEARFLPHFIDQLRAKRKSNLGQIWPVDETCIRVNGRWCYLYRGIDEAVNWVDVRLITTRDMAGTQAFFARATELQEPHPSG